jgi:hypothetical protein
LSSTPAKSGCELGSPTADAGAIFVPVSGSADVRGTDRWSAVFAAQGVLQPPLDAAHAQPIAANTKLVRIADIR